MTDPNGHLSTRTFDAQGNVTAAADGLGRTTTATYDSLNDPLTVIDPNGVITTMAYDGSGNLTSVSTPLVGSSPAQSQTTTYTYGSSAPGDVTSMTDPNAKVWTLGYDSYGDRSAVTDPQGNQTLSCFDTAGRKTATISALGTAAGTT